MGQKSYLAKCLLLKFIYSEKATKLCKISTLDLTVLHTVKSKVEISQNFVVFSEYISFTTVAVVPPPLASMVLACLFLVLQLYFTLYALSLALRVRRTLF